MRYALVGLLLACALTAAAAPQPWSMREDRDPMTDRVTRLICTTNADDVALCIFETSALGRLTNVMLQVPARSASLDRRVPWLRIDSRPLHDGPNVADVSRDGRVVIWAAEARGRDGYRRDGLLSELISGTSLRVRYWTTSGAVDTIFDLSGLSGHLEAADIRLAPAAAPRPARPRR